MLNGSMVNTYWIVNALDGKYLLDSKCLLDSKILIRWYMLIGQ